MDIEVILFVICSIISFISLICLIYGIVQYKTNRKHKKFHLTMSIIAMVGLFIGFYGIANKIYRPDRSQYLVYIDGQPIYNYNIVKCNIKYDDKNKIIYINTEDLESNYKWLPLERNE